MDPLLQNIALLLLASLPVCMYAYSNGQVTDACSSMTPSHGAPAQTSSPPYTLSLDKYTYSAGDKIKVTLSSTSGQFKGFLIQARSGSNATPVGSFQTSNSNTQTLTCTTAASSVSHTSGIGKSSVDVTWVAPTSNIADIQIRATVVQTERVFWTNVISAKIAYASADPATTTTVGTPSSSNTTTSTGSNSTTSNSATSTSTTSATSTSTTSATSTSTTSATSTSTTTKKPSGSSGVQHTWTLEALLLSCAVVMASLLA
ncbi:defense protein l(2)34Fc-like [Dendropsophus ebraccatus]|uniref:defense protein l(2)34Fc-like n=1 Tax=Dendropsophus ebraccatus TaxID=150705 RepID=UPI0038319372